MRQLFITFLCLISISTLAQQITISPLPQQITWGDVAFTNDRQPAIRMGKVGDKAVKAYVKLVPKQAEGYYLKVTPQEVIIVGRDEAGLFYGQQTYRQIAAQPMVMQCEITDWPSVACRGVIEGFYGNPWSHQDRLRQFDFYGQNKMNIYVYGPKNDPYHRAHWRDPYPEAEADRLRELVEAAHRNHVQFVWAIHPGGDIQWNLSDSMAVCNKLEKMYELGIRTFAVFFDDIGGEGARGEKQAGLLNYVTDKFVHRHKDVQPLIMCPTQYNKAWSGGDYLNTLGTQMYPEVRIMWTGNSVVDMIQHEDMEWINAQIHRKAFIWLNYPVNDYCQSRLLMGKTYGNDLDINDMVSGFCSNPMEYAEASKVSLYSIADYTWNMPQYNAEESWRRTFKYLMPTAVNSFFTFCENNIDLGKTGHGLRREGESAIFNQIKDHPDELALFFMGLQQAANELLADSVNHPEMINEIKPWVESMGLLGQRGCAVWQMERLLAVKDSVAFVGQYKAQVAMEQAQKAIISRNYEGSIVKAKPVVSGDVITPWINEKVGSLIKEYKKQHNYGREAFPQQVLEDGQYMILCDGKFLTNVNASPDRTGDFPVFVAERDTINPQRQQWNIELNATTGRYKITNAQDGRYINERGAFWANRDLNPFEPQWHTFTITKEKNAGYTLQCGGSAGKGFLNADGNRIVNTSTSFSFEIVPVK